jgi:hypothetical protein
MVTTVATSLTGATRNGILPQRRWTASMTLSVPWPSASGATTCTIPKATRKPSGSKSSGTVADCAAAIPTARTLRKRAVEDPAKVPAAAASSVHFNRLASSVPSSIPRCLAHVSKASPGLIHEAGAGSARHLIFIESPIFMDPPMP